MRKLFFLAAIFAPQCAPALTIDITGGSETGIPVAVLPFVREGVDSKTFPAEIIESDLARSGRFEPLPRESFLERPGTAEEIDYKVWRALKVENLITGRMRALDAARIEMQFQLHDVFAEKQLAAETFHLPHAQLRKASHQISDSVHQKLLGIRGAADTRIAYVAVDDSPRRYLLRIADADGHSPKTILESPQPILSPAWSPDGARLAYVSFEKRRSMIFIQHLRSGTRTPLATFAGINSAPAWSPGGKRLALTLSKDGNPEIYVYEIAAQKLRRLTTHTAIDTEPAWSPDGREIAFTSNRSGMPQIYRMPSAGGDARRVTFRGDYNAGAAYSPDGKSIALVTHQGRGHRVAVYSASDFTLRELTAGRHDESPSFSPNGGMLIYAARIGGRNVLATVSANARARQVVRTEFGEVREAAWSPYNPPLPARAE